MPQPIVLFGGSFDPVHHGHLIAARAVAEKRGWAKVTFLPAGRPPHKGPAVASAEDRLAMLRLAIAGEALFDICDLELRRRGPSYTFETLSELRRLHGPEAPLVMVVGMDMLPDLPTWRRAGEVLELAEVVVAARPPFHGEREAILARLRDKLGQQAAERLAANVVSTPLIDISATEIRRRRCAGLSIRYLVPDNVAACIERRGLYAR